MQYFSQLFLEINYNFGIFALNGIIPLNNKQIFPNENSQSIWPDTKTNDNSYGKHVNGIIHTISDSYVHILNSSKKIENDQLYKQSLQETTNKDKTKQAKTFHRIHRKS